MIRIGLVALLVASTAGAAGAAPPTQRRTVTVEYQASSGVTGVISGPTYVGSTRVGHVVVPLLKGERTVTLTVRDDTGRIVAASYGLDTDTDGGVDRAVGTFCGTARDKPLPTDTGHLVVVLEIGTCGSEASFPTFGEVVVELTRPVAKKK